VANLPFSLDDEGLTKLFQEHKVSKAHVVKNRNGRSKGFGFVEFDKEADQKSALDASSKLTCDGRELIVKIALTAPEPREGAPTNNGGAKEGGSPTSSTASAAKEAQPAAKDEKSS
jgi:RNA recognition motif-containing protein